MKKETKEVSLVTKLSNVINLIKIYNEIYPDYNYRMKSTAYQELLVVADMLGQKIIKEDELPGFTSSKKRYFETKEVGDRQMKHLQKNYENHEGLQYLGVWKKGDSLVFVDAVALEHPAVFLISKDMIDELTAIDNRLK